MSNSHKRPLSPHIQIYQWSVLMALSILHRLSGIALYSAFILLVSWLVSVNIGVKPFMAYSEFLASLPGRFLLFLASWALIHHLMGGLRHLIWDMGHNFDPARARIMALGLSVVAFLLTLIVWSFGYGLI